MCQKKRRAFFLCVSGYFVIVVLTTIKKEKERILPQHVLSLTRECRKQCHCRIYVLIKIGFSADSGHINTIMIRKNALFCKLIRIKKSSKVLLFIFQTKFHPFYFNHRNYFDKVTDRSYLLKLPTPIRCVEP